MSIKRRQDSPDLKARVGFEALKNIDTIQSIAAKYEVHPVQVSACKKEVSERLPEIFTRKNWHAAEDYKEREIELFEEIGRLKM
jgi:transposase-like protein